MSKNDDLDAVLRQLQAKGTQTAKPGVPNPLLHGGKDPHTDGGPTADKAPFTLASRPTGPVPTRDPDDAAKTTELEITSLEPRLPRFVSPPESPPPVPRSVARNASTTADQDDERTRQIELPTGSDVPVNLDTADAVEIPPDVVKAPRPPPRSISPSAGIRRTSPPPPPRPASAKSDAPVSREQGPKQDDNSVEAQIQRAVEAVVAPLTRQVNDLLRQNRIFRALFTGAASIDLLERHVESQGNELFDSDQAERDGIELENLAASGRLGLFGKVEGHADILKAVAGDMTASEAQTLAAVLEAGRYGDELEPDVADNLERLVERLPAFGYVGKIDQMHTDVEFLRTRSDSEKADHNVLINRTLTEYLASPQYNAQQITNLLELVGSERLKEALAAIVEDPQVAEKNLLELVALRNGASVETLGAQGVSFARDTAPTVVQRAQECYQAIELLEEQIDDGQTNATGGDV